MSGDLTLASILRLVYMIGWNKFKSQEEARYLAEGIFGAAHLSDLIALKRAAESNLALAVDELERHPKSADPSEVKDWETVVYVIKEQIRGRR